MIKKYIKGNKVRGAEVIKALEELGGVNCDNHKGIRTDCFYYIKENSIIDLVQDFTPFGKVIQECYEEIKLPEQFNVVIKVPKQIYWFRATKDDTKNQALFDKLCDLVGIDKRSTKVSDGIVYFNPLRDAATFCPNHNIYSSIECTTAMLIGKELRIEQQ